VSASQTTEQPAPMALDHDAELLPVDLDCEYAISSTGRLLIQSNGTRMALPAEHVKPLVAFLVEQFGVISGGQAA
jgi:hypothetical protein